MTVFATIRGNRRTRTVEKWKDKLSDMLSDRLYQIIISNPRKKGGAVKIKIRPVMVKGQICYQETITRGTQVFHENHEKEEMLDRILSYMGTDFKQLEAETMDSRLIALVSKDGKATVKERKKEREEAAKRPELSHNRSKQYLLEEGKPVPFLVDLGIQTKDGKIVRAKYDKFKQINRYLEFVEDILPALKKEGPVRIIDFGCGKSYLTFALYYFLHELKQMEVSIAGLDLKRDVIEKCNLLAQKYGYRNLHFYHGDISGYREEGEVDMVVTLHACDTATDYAIQKAVSWNAKVIFTVPCCQHEVNGQMENEILEPILKYGLLKERMAALVTDAVRANLMEEAGYDTQVLEFIDMEHTPKNILIRAVKGRMPERKGKRDTGVARMTEVLQVNTTLQKLMEK